MRNIFSLFRRPKPAEISARGKSLRSSTRSMIRQHLWLRILIGMVLGVALGLILSPSGDATMQEIDRLYALGDWIAIPGVLFLGLIKMVITPLVICSIILGISSSGDPAFLKQMGARILPYFLVTSSLAITIGMVIAYAISPGEYIDQSLIASLTSGAESQSGAARTFDDLTIPQRIGNLIPTNLTQAALDKNMLQIVIAAIIIGVVIITIPKSTAKPFVDLCVAGQVITMKIISWAMIIAPLAVFGLLCNITIKIGFDALLGVGMYMSTVLLGLLCMLLVYTVLIAVFAKRSPLAFFKSIRSVQLLAFSTSSSAAVMPLSIQTAEEKLNIRPEISRFVVPLGATINMDGTGLYQAVAAVFLCQVFNVDLTIGQMILLMATTVGASIGTPATPGVGIVVLATILAGIGIPAEGIGLILGVDRILDMCRTTVNVTGDLTATAIMQRWLPRETKDKLDQNTLDQDHETPPEQAAQDEAEHDKKAE